MPRSTRKNRITINNMGQAKRRGTYEERKASAIHDQELVKSILDKQEKTWWNELPSEEQKALIQKRLQETIMQKAIRKAIQ